MAFSASSSVITVVPPSFAHFVSNLASSAFPPTLTEDVADEAPAESVLSASLPQAVVRRATAAMVAATAVEDRRVIVVRTNFVMFCPSSHAVRAHLLRLFRRQH
uniref:hypothetical protein n=1 Tax=Rhodococcus erythropolis TaxID=1833 RepID=UPI0020364C9F|nr:hypothetical protein [Rhodococcus erythropolis]